MLEVTPGINIIVGANNSGKNENIESFAVIDKKIGEHHFTPADAMRSHGG